ncbi:dihydrofolate reductase [Gordonia sp. AC31]|uniref:dihydrofolate reductase n=1 Tax=Gordonia sp. AC31 TaxID=2962571 RepID=UPI002880D3C7|nr:dihydrofolate reductase [Gordonia sp. AC31]MDT0220709.1 dihydrofolate reductase [Gordonia sp. AC31]
MRLVWAQGNGAAIDKAAIGRDNTIPWRVPEDMARFKKLTLGHPVIMGRKTWDSLPEKFRPLSGRTNIVVTRNRDWSVDGALVAPTIEEALRLADDDTVSVIGGGEIYRAAMRFATELCVTEIDVDVPGADAFAPKVEPEWTVARKGEPQISSTGLSYRFIDYVRERG